VGGLGSLDRWAWVADALHQFSGSGIVYALTVAEADRLAAFLQSAGHRVSAYSGRLESAERIVIEDQLRDNQLKAVVATSALGMGYDKPDLAFCIHVGSPASPVAYYQQVGRAGRALDHAVAVLLPSDADEAIWHYFATATIPDPDQVERVLAVLRGGTASMPALESTTGIRRGRLEGMLKLLAAVDVVTKSNEGWQATGTPYVHDAERWRALRAARAAEAEVMRRYAAGDGCLMSFLQLALDDPDPQPCGRCSVCTGQLPHPGARPSDASLSAARIFARGVDVIIEPRKMWPSGLDGRKGRISGCEAGRALAFADDPGWADEVAQLQRGDRPIEPAVADGLVEVLRRWKHQWPERPVAVVPIPSRSHPRRVASIAQHVGEVGRLPVIDAFQVSGAAPPDDAASGARARSLLAGLRLDPAVQVPQGPLLLVDDTYRTGWTATVAASLLRQAGATAVLPLVVHQLP
jgi:ATP-dependent DNA helicase RecQ